MKLLIYSFIKSSLIITAFFCFSNASAAISNQFKSKMKPTRLLASVGRTDSAVYVNRINRIIRRKAKAGDFEAEIMIESSKCAEHCVEEIISLLHKNHYQTKSEFNQETITHFLYISWR